MVGEKLWKTIRIFLNLRTLLFLNMLDIKQSIFLSRKVQLLLFECILAIKMGVEMENMYLFSVVVDVVASSGV